MPRGVLPLLGALILFNVVIILLMILAVPWDGPAMTLAPALHVQSRTANVVAGHYTFLPPFNDLSNQPQPRLPLRPDQPPRPAPLVTNHFLYPFGVHQRGLDGVGLYLASLLVMFALSISTLYLFPTRLIRVRDHLFGNSAEILRSLLSGILGYIMLTVLVVLMVMLVVGIPIALVLMFGALLLSLAGWVTASLLVGRWLAERFGVGATSPSNELVLGILLLFPITIVPLIGWLVAIVGTAVGFGTILLTKFASNGGWRL